LLKDNTLEVMARIRYRQPLQPARLIKVIDDYYLLFNDLQRGITPGQFAAWYINDELIGSAVILH
jgi:tRNA-specific 2-thiouridylase